MKEEEIKRRIEKIESNCINLAKEENAVLKKENNDIKEKMLSEKIESYNKELEKKLINEFNKMARDFNKNVFEYNMESRRKVTQFKNTLQVNIHKLLIERFIAYADEDEYFDYLQMSIEQVMAKVEKNENCTIYITNKDASRFKETIENKYGVSVESIDDTNIGGCMLLNKVEKVSIDNTLKNNISERIKNVKIGV